RPENPYTQRLIEAIPSAESRGERLSPVVRSHSLGEARKYEASDAPVLKAERLFKSFRGPDGVDRTVVNDVSFELKQGETLGIVGESGSGKTTTARLALALLETDGGSVTLAGEEWTGLPERERRKRRDDISVIYQDPLSSFDPRWTVEQIMLDALGQGYDGKKDRKARIAQLLEMVGLEAEHLKRRT